MSSKNHLLLGQGFLTMILIVSLGLIIVNEKSEDLLINKADKAIDNYLETNYQELLPSIDKEKTQSKNKVYSKKIISKQNKNHYFYIYYDKRKLSDTYTTDFEEGKALLTHINKDLEKEIKSKTNIDCTIQPTTTLNEYSTSVNERIIKEENLLELKFYCIQKELIIENWNKQEITNQIKNIIQKMKEKNITPKYYEITISDQKDITMAIKISNITEDFLDNGNAEKIIEDILNHKDISNSKITYQYKN